jgi:hypothetical protein
MENVNTARPSPYQLFNIGGDAAGGLAGSQKGLGVEDDLGNPPASDFAEVRGVGDFQESFLGAGEDSGDFDFHWSVDSSGAMRILVAAISKAVASMFLFSIERGSQKVTADRSSSFGGW